MGPTLAEKINHLFGTVRPAGRGAYTNAEVAAATGLAESLIGYLRCGKRANPTMNTLLALSRHFGVAPAYFLDDALAAQVDATQAARAMLEVLGGALRRAEIQELVSRLATLPAEDVTAMIAIADRLQTGRQPALTRGTMTR